MPREPRIFLSWGKTCPDLVVLPQNTKEVSAVIQLCHQHHIPFIARGAGTGLSGGALALNGGIIISLAKMNQILDIDPLSLTATVQPGMVNAWLNDALKKHQLFYAPDPSSQSACTIGGNVAENAGGIHCIKYGVTTNHILEIEMVLPDGTVITLGSANRRHRGFNLQGVVTGSEGTLGIVTQVKVKLTPLAKTTKVFLAAFEKTKDSTHCVADIIQSGLIPAALEFMDHFTVTAVNQAFHIGFPENAEAVLLIELDGDPKAVETEETLLRSLLEKNSVSQIRTGDTEEERQTLWHARKKAVAAYGRFLPAFYLHDTVIPRSKLTEVLTQIIEISKKYDMTVGNVFHAGDGNLHPNILFDPDDRMMMDRVMRGGEEILKVCLEAGGTLSGEHGIGLEKSEYMNWIYSHDDLEKMLTVKTVFDPETIANPGKIFPTPGGCGEAKCGMDMSQTLSTHEGVWI